MSCYTNDIDSDDTSPLVHEVIGNASDVPPGTKKIFEVKDRKILVINDNGTYYAVNGLCSHYNFPLENGVYSKGRIRCPLHGACFNVKTGDIEDYPGYDSLHTFEVKERDGQLIINTTEKKLESDRRVRKFKKTKPCNDIPIVVIGSGPAVATFIEHSRINGLVTPILVLTEENWTPYDRVLLSKNPVLTGDQIQLRKDDFYTERNVEFRRNSKVVSVNPCQREVQTEDGSVIRFSKLVIASGAHVRKLNVPGANFPNIHYLRRVEEANRIANESKDKRVVIIGASFIGMEVASALVANAKSVTVISSSPEPLPVFGQDVGKGVRTKFEERGVKFVLGGHVKGLSGISEANKVFLDNGDEIDGDIFIVGIGVEASTKFLEGTKVQLDKRGFILVDKHFRTTAEFVYAIGDVTSFPLPQWDIDTINIQHFQMAQLHGQYLGYSIVGKPQPAPIVPYFWSLFFFAIGIKFSGCAQGYDKEIVHGKPETEPFVKYYLKNKRVVAVCAHGPSNAAIEFEELFRRGVHVTSDQVKKNKDDNWQYLLDGHVQK